MSVAPFPVGAVNVLVTVAHSPDIKYGCNLCTNCGTFILQQMPPTKWIRARDSKKTPAVFYQSSPGREPVRVWLKTLDDQDRKVIGEDIATVEYGWPIGMPTCRPLGKGLAHHRLKEIEK